MRTESLIVVLNSKSNESRYQRIYPIMTHRVTKTTFEKEQAEKDAAFLRLSPLERLALMYKVRKQMRKPGIDYSLAGKKVTVKKNEPLR